MYKGYIYRHWVINDKGVEKNYIGQVYNRTPKQRWGKDGNGYKPKKGDEPTHFYNAIQTYGWDNFNHKVLFSIECETLEELVFWLDEWEKYYIEKYDSFKHGYNSTTGGSNGLYCEKTKQKISESHKALYEQGYINPLKGKKLSEETKHKISESHKGIHAGDKNPFYGKHHTEESKQKLSQEIKGKYVGDKHPRAKKVICLNTLEIFTTTKEAGEVYNIYKSTISGCCKGKLKSAGKHPETGERLHWMYYSDYLEQQNKDKSDSKIA